MTILAKMLIPQNPAKPAQNNFNALRLAMAILVVWSHSFALYHGSEDNEPLSILFGGIYNAGNIAVLAFFAISGFLISQSWERSSTWRRYLRKRIMRIVPGYVAALLMCSLVIVPAFSTRTISSFAGGEWFGIASNILLRNYIIRSDAFGGGAVNGSLWSIPYEFWCYLGVLALGALGLTKRRWLFAVIAVAVMLVRVWLDVAGRKPGGGFIGSIIGFPYFWFNVLPPFALGAFVFYYQEHIPRRLSWCIGLFALFLIACHLPIAGPAHDVFAKLLLPVALTYWILYAAFSDVHFGDAARFGDFSYGTYLYAFPIQQMLVWSLKDQLSFPLFIALSACLSVLAGMASWMLVERWFKA
jgi:peptidoglycan/LPS O-acetylase OafA/YrhL